MQTLTTHKHDFLNKPFIRVDPIKPRDLIMRAQDPLEKETTMKLSFQANKENIGQLKSFKPIYHYQKPGGKFFVLK